MTDPKFTSIHYIRRIGELEAELAQTKAALALANEKLSSVVFSL